MTMMLSLFAAGAAMPFAACDEPPPPVTATFEERRLQIEGLRNSDDVRTAVRHLIAVDSDLSAVESFAPLQKRVLIALAGHRTPPALEYLRSVFETQTHRRHDAAFAISLAAVDRPTNDQDWRYLVRSLPIVEGEQAVSVLNALRRYRRRATKATWVREVILLGLRLPDKSLPAVIELLEFWTGHPRAESQAPRDQLKHYQNWFLSQHPGQPAAELAVDPAGAKWTFAKLATVITELPTEEAFLTAGAIVYAKANCNKCHRREGVTAQPADDRLGPNLTSLGWRRQPKEVVSAILYPSHRLNDEYPVTTVALQNGKTVTGLLMNADEGRLKVFTTDSKEIIFAKNDVEETVPSAVSNMPAGLLEALSAEDVRNLFAFLTVQSGEYDPHRR